VTSDVSVTGRVWVFGDSLNTDDMYPAHAMRLDIPRGSEAVLLRRTSGMDRRGAPW